MATTTPNFGWSVPTSTDLVKDGATAIETLGDSVDASMADLLGGTSGQMLVKNSNSNMDFIWQTPNVGDITEVQAGTGISVASGTGPIPVITNTATTTIDAEGDLLVGDAADALQRLPIGTNGHILTVDTTVDGKIKWAAAAGGGGKVLQVVPATYSSSLSTSTGSFVDTGLQAIITPTLASSKVLILMTNQMGASRTGDDCYYKFRLVRGATSIFVGNGNTGFATASVSNAKQIYNTDNASFLDNPATTSATTYKVQISSVGGSTATAQYNDSASLILLEIGA